MEQSSTMMDFQVPDAAVPAVTTLIVFTSLSVFTLILRLYTRAALVKNVGADDYLMICSVAGSVAFLAVVFLQIKYGLGRQVTFEELPSFLMALWGTIPLYNVALIFCKLSITAQYYRVFRMPGMQLFLKFIIAFLIVYGTWAILGTIFTCWPVAKYWDLTIRDGKCLSRNGITYANAGINIGTDVTLLAIPLLLLKDIHIPTPQKIILLGVFACGGFACAVSIVRLKALAEIAAAPPAQQSVDGVNIAIWSCLEINVGIICASVPALKAMAVRIAPKLLLSSLYSRSRHPYHNQEDPQLNEVINFETSSSKPNSTRKKSQILVQHTFEMTGFSKEARNQSLTLRDSSEENLVLSSSKIKDYEGEYCHEIGAAS